MPSFTGLIRNFNAGSSPTKYAENYDKIDWSDDGKKENPYDPLYSITGKSGKVLAESTFGNFKRVRCFDCDDGWLNPIAKEADHYGKGTNYLLQCESCKGEFQAKSAKGWGIK